MEKMKREEELKYLKAGFSADQINEITEGTNAGLNAAVYAKKEFLAIQMRQIRLGMLEKLPVGVYAKTEYDWFQMEEIREGLKAGLDIAVYALPAIPYDKMRQVRLGLADGVDLSKYLNRDAGIIREIRRALRANISLADYIREGYGTEQLEQIRIALEKGVNIHPYVSTELRGVSIREISLGLAKGLDVSYYAKAECSWQQMREIRLGLEHRIDVSCYQSLLYSWQQMREIRLGLENGIDISSYQSLMYPAAEMEKRRLSLKQHLDVAGTAASARESAGLDIGYYEQFQIRVSADEMQAYVELNFDTAPTRGELLDALQETGVVQGILDEAVFSVIQGKCPNQTVLIARGQEPQNGRDGRYEYFFQAHKERKPKMLPDGSVDYQNTEWFEMVHEGQTVARYQEAKEGSSGFTVTGKILPAKKGKEKSVLSGEGFLLKEDRKTYLAAVGGKIDLIGNYLKISNLLAVPEVTLATGNINFDGSVHVMGNVGGGAVIQATEDVIVDGYVEGAKIQSGGNIVLRRGMNAFGNGMLSAAGSIHGNFFEAVEIHAKKGIYANYCLNAVLCTEEKITVSGIKGSLVGGLAQAGKGLDAYFVGNRAGRRTVIRLGVSEALVKACRELNDKLKEVKEELMILKNAYLDFQKKYPAEVRNTMELYLKIEDAIYTKETQFKELLVERNGKEGEQQKLQEAAAVIRGIVFDGVVIEIGDKGWVAKEVQNITVRNIGDRVAVYRN